MHILDEKEKLVPVQNLRYKRSKSMR